MSGFLQKSKKRLKAPIILYIVRARFKELGCPKVGVEVKSGAGSEKFARVVKVLRFCTFILLIMAPWKVVLSEPFTAGLTALSREHATTAFRSWMKVAKQGGAD